MVNLATSNRLGELRSYFQLLVIVLRKLDSGQFESPSFQSLLVPRLLFILGPFSVEPVHLHLREDGLNGTLVCLRPVNCHHRLVYLVQIQT